MNKMTTSILIISIFGFQSIFAAFAVNPDLDLLDGAIDEDIEQVQAAVAQHANINAVNPMLNMTALHAAVFRKNYAIAQYLLKEGADPNIADTSGNTPLHTAVIKRSPDIVKLLLDKGADPTLRDVNGQTPADLLKMLPYYKQNEPNIKRIRQYFTEAARPMPEIAL